MYLFNTVKYILLHMKINASIAQFSYILYLHVYNFRITQCGVVKNKTLSKVICIW